MKSVKTRTMKFLLLSGLGLSFMLCCNCVIGSTPSDNPVNPPAEVKVNTVNIMVSPELNNLTADLVREYEKVNPGVKFKVGNMEGTETNNPGTIYFLATGPAASPAGWQINIGHNVIVPVMNEKNPMLRDIVEKGISAREFALLFNGSGEINWSDLIEGGQHKSVTAYIINNPGIKTAISDFTQTFPASVNSNLMENSADLIGAIQKDPYAIGFCRLSDVRREGENEFAENIRLLPIDKNGNGRIDMFENIYNTPEDLSRGVWIGKYPHALSGNIYAISHSRPTDKNAMAFLAWIVTDGGKYLVSNGYGDLISMEKRATLAALSENPESLATASSPASLPWVMILGLVIVAGLTVLVLTVVFRRSEPVDADETITPVLAFNANTISSPKGLYYDKTHTWAFMEHDGNVRMGIDDFLLHVTGTITRIAMKETGEFVRRGEKIVTLTKFGKQLSLYSPVSGTIKARNVKLDENSSLVNNSPYADGWVYLVEPKNWTRELQFMLMGEKHMEWLRNEFIRLRNFFEGTLKTRHVNMEFAILQDGGELRDNLLADQGPEVWEEFQRKFVDLSR
jgi:glycine cleavage system H lipoate-binding protein/ABC-type phosphate transport system substrate-binding protein